MTAATLDYVRQFERCWLPVPGLASYEILSRAVDTFPSKDVFCYTALERRIRHGGHSRTEAEEFPAITER